MTGADHRDRAFIDGWNEHPVPLAWAKDAGEILGDIEHAKAESSVLANH